MPIATDPGVDELIERLACDANGRFDRALGDALQEHINAVEGTEGARECIRRVAATAHFRLPQYAGHWSGDEWQVGTVGTRVRTKSGVAFEPGDVVLFKRDGYQRVSMTAYSIATAWTQRSACTCARGPDDARRGH